MSPILLGHPQKTTATSRDICRRSTNGALWQVLMSQFQEISNNASPDLSSEHSSKTKCLSDAPLRQLHQGLSVIISVISALRLIYFSSSIPRSPPNSAQLPEDILSFVPLYPKL